MKLKRQYKRSQVEIRKLSGLTDGDEETQIGVLFDKIELNKPIIFYVSGKAIVDFYDKSIYDVPEKYVVPTENVNDVIDNSSDIENSSDVSE